MELCPIVDFNPRSHEGSDSFRSHSASVCRIFQSTLPRGERLNTPTSQLYKEEFQSTLPRGERRRHQQTFRYIILNFNPRSHEGSDLMIVSSIDTLIISIHAPTRGATKFEKNPMKLSTFQSTLPRGERREIQSIPIILCNRFQSTLPRGERREIQSIPIILCNRFQSTLPRGERHLWEKCVCAG